MSAPDRKLHVAYVLRKFPVMSETFVLNEILGLEDRGVRVEIFSLAPPRDPRFHEQLSRLRAPVWYVPGLTEHRNLLAKVRLAARQHGRPFRRTLARVLSTGRPSLLMRFLQAGYVAERAARLGVQHFHAHFATRATTAALLASSISGIPYSFTAHAFDIYRSSVRPQVLSDKIRNASFVVTISEANREYLKGVANGSAANVALVRNGIDLQRFRPNGATADPPFTVLSVARLVEKKGLPVLVAACRILRDRGVSFRCQIIGRGRQRPQLLDLIDRWDLRRTVRLLGGRRQGEVLEFYRSAHAYVLPSIVGGDGNKEGLPVSIVEALACGLPVVSTPIAGIPEVVTHGTNGLLVPPGDAAALADALQRIITDRATYDRLRNNARRTVEKSFDTGQTSKDLHELFLGASA